MIIPKDQLRAWADKALRDAVDYENKAVMLDGATVEGKSGMLLAQELRSAAHHLKTFAKKVDRGGG